MNPTKCLQLFLSLKLHFSKPSYNWFKYKGELKYVPDLSKRKDKYQIMKIAKHDDPQGLLLANLSLNPHQWPGDILGDKGLSTYKSWKKRIESLNYTFEQEIKQLQPDFNSNFSVPKYQHPFALRLFLGEHISLETLSILNLFVKFYPAWNKALQGDIVWNEVGYQLPKYRPFIHNYFTPNSNQLKKTLMEQLK